MGFYINPKYTTKEAWLEAHATPINLLEAYEIFLNKKQDEYLPVCLIENTFFTAAGIAFSPAELKAFSMPDDWRPKQFFKAKKEDLLKICPDLKNIPKG